MDPEKQPQVKRDRSGRVVTILGHSIELSGFALLLMLVAILLPTVMYSLSLRRPTPAELLIAVSIGMFASVLYLWVLDATSTITFRSPWISRGVYGAAIVSILGTSVGVYKDAFVEPFPFQGEWLLTVMVDPDSSRISDRPVALAYSRKTGVYWGYGARPDAHDRTASGTATPLWVEVTGFDPGNGSIAVRLINAEGVVEDVNTIIGAGDSRTGFSGTGGGYSFPKIFLRRRNQ